MDERKNIDQKVDEKIDEKVEAAKIIPSVKRLAPEINLPSRTTIEDDLRSAGQRDINLIWENTQRNLAYAVVSAALTSDFLTVAVGLYCFVIGIKPSVEVVIIWSGALMQVNTMAGIVIGFYFGRTNHARIGDDPNKRSGGGLDDR